MRLAPAHRPGATGIAPTDKMQTNDDNDKPGTLPTERPAKLKDVKQLIETNKMFDNPTTTNSQAHTLRPPLNATSTPNNSGGPRKKQRRGGRKYKAMMAKRAERAAETNGQNTTTATSSINANLLPHTPNAQSSMQTVPAKQPANANKWRHKLQDSNTPKRTRVTGDTPPDAAQARKNPMRTHNTHTPTTYIANLSLANAVIEANLVVAVYDQPAENIILPMSKVKYEQLYATINDTLFSDIEECTVILTFTENKHVRGFTKVKCATPGAKTWLIDAIQRMTPLWQNMQLKVVEFNKQNNK